MSYSATQPLQIFVFINLSFSKHWTTPNSF
jgi:hypothetical protein